MRFPKRWPLRAAVVAAALVVVGVPIAWASHQFADVPNTNPHHNDISVIAGAGITTGCAVGLYCPDLPVRRDQMATFLRRGLGRGAYDHTGGGVAVGTTDTTIASVTLQVPGDGFVLVTGATDYVASGSNPCNIVQRVIRPVTGQASWYSGTGNAAAGAGDMGVTSTALLPTQAGGRIFQIHARRIGSCTSASAWPDLTAVYIPFGAAGDNNPSPSDPGAQQLHIKPTPVPVTPEP